MNAPKTTISITTSTIVKALGIVLFAGILFYLRDIVFIILTAVVIASAVEPLAVILVKLKIPRVIAVLLIYLVLISAISLFVYFVLPYIVHELADFMNILPAHITSLDVSSHDFFGWQSTVQGLSQSESIGEAAQSIVSSLTTASGSLITSLSTFFGGAISFILIIVVSFYLAVQKGGIEDFIRLVTPIKTEEYAVSLWQRTQHKIGRWIQGQFILAVIMGMLVYIGLSILGVENALFLAFISMILEVIPVFGPIIGAFPGVAVGFIKGGVPFATIIALMYLILQQIESHVIYPLVVKKLLNIPPLVVIIALIIGGRVGGFLGILLSVPMAVLITEYLSDIGKDKILAREQFINNG
jgi:predicted PurR-regulated permease PerM